MYTLCVSVNSKDCAFLQSDQSRSFPIAVFTHCTVVCLKQLNVTSHRMAFANFKDNIDNSLFFIVTVN